MRVVSNHGGASRDKSGTRSIKPTLIGVTERQKNRGMAGRSYKRTMQTFYDKGLETCIAHRVIENCEPTLRRLTDGCHHVLLEEVQPLLCIFMHQGIGELCSANNLLPDTISLTY